MADMPAHETGESEVPLERETVSIAPGVQCVKYKIPSNVDKELINSIIKILHEWEADGCDRPEIEVAADLYNLLRKERR